jgi:hypothetical protein
MRSGSAASNLSARSNRASRLGAVDAPLDVVARAGSFGDRLSLVRALAAFERRGA